MKYLIFFENTFLYFLVGPLWGAFVPFHLIVRDAVLVWLILAPIEYLLMKAERSRRWFTPKGDPPTKFEFAWTVYHAYWFLIIVAASIQLGKH